jgi:hypothetical protein
MCILYPKLEESNGDIYMSNYKKQRLTIFITPTENFSQNDSKYSTIICIILLANNILVVKYSKLELQRAKQTLIVTSLLYGVVTFISY